jgi:hypothetical protein
MVVLFIILPLYVNGIVLMVISLYDFNELKFLKYFFFIIDVTIKIEKMKIMIIKYKMTTYINSIYYNNL